MARPKIHEEPGERVYLSASLIPKIEKWGKPKGLSRRQAMEALILQGLGSQPTNPSSTGRAEGMAEAGIQTSSSWVTNPSMKDCAHKYRVQRGGQSVCPSCGDVA